MSNDISSVSAKSKVVDQAEVKDEAGNVTTPATYKEVTATVNFNVPASLDALVAKFGNDVVANQAQAALVISLQAFVRRHIEKPQAELQAMVDAWKPETRTTAQRKSAAEKVDDLIGGLDADATAALIAKLKAQQAAARKG